MADNNQEPPETPQEEVKEVPYNWDLDQEGNLIEKYPENLEENDFQLVHKWVLWEQFRKEVPRERGGYNKGKDDNFVDNMRKVGYFNSVFGFCRL